LLVTVGAAGIAFTTAAVVAVTAPQPTTVAVTVYVPLAPTGALPILGFCVTVLNAFGPDQLYDAPAMLLAVNCNVLPAHKGPLLNAFNVGAAVTLTSVVT